MRTRFSFMGLAGLVLALAACAGEQGANEKIADPALIAERLQTSLSDEPITLFVRIDGLHNYCDFSNETLSIDAGHVLSMSGAYRCFGVNPSGPYETDSGAAGFTRIDLKKVDPASISLVERGETPVAENYLQETAQIVVSGQDTPPYVTGICSEQVITKEPRSRWCVSIGAGDAAAHFDRFFIPCETESACGLILDHLKQLAAAAEGSGAASGKSR